MVDSFVTCPGCGLTIASDKGALDTDVHAVSACRDLYFQLTYYTLSLHDPTFIHQLAVDAYAAQHVGEKTKPITVAFALVGLYLVNEREFTGKQVQNVHIALAKKSKTWPSFDPPSEKDWLTILDVFNMPDGKKDAKIHAWSKSVWNAWKKEQDSIKQLLNHYLDLP